MALTLTLRTQHRLQFCADAQPILGARSYRQCLPCAISALAIAALDRLQGTVRCACKSHALLTNQGTLLVRVRLRKPALQAF